LGVSGLDIEREGEPAALERDTKTGSGILALALNRRFKLSLPVILFVSSRLSIQTMLKKNGEINLNMLG